MTFWGPGTMSIYKIQKFHLNTVDFWAKTMLLGPIKQETPPTRLNQKDILKTWKARSKSQLRTQISPGTWFKIWKLNFWLIWKARSEQFGADYEQNLRLVFLKFSFWKHCSICIIEVKKSKKKKLGSLF